MEARRSIEIQPTTQGEWDLGLATWLPKDRIGAERAFLDALALCPSTSRAHFILELFYMDFGAQHRFRSREPSRTTN